MLKVCWGACWIVNRFHPFRPKWRGAAKWSPVSWGQVNTWHRLCIVYCQIIQVPESGQRGSNVDLQISVSKALFVFWFFSRLHEVKRDYYSDFVFFSIHTNWPKIVLKKFYEILWSQIESFGLANWTKKVFFFRLTYNTGKDWRVPLSVFPALWIFFPIFFLPKGPPPFF